MLIFRLDVAKNRGPRRIPRSLAAQNPRGRSPFDSPSKMILGIETRTCWEKIAEEGKPWIEKRGYDLWWIVIDRELGYYAYDGESVENGRRKRGKATRVTRDYHIAGLGPSDFIHIRRYCYEVTSRASSWLTVDHWNPPFGRKLSVSLKGSGRIRADFLVRERKKKIVDFVIQILLNITAVWRKNDSFWWTDSFP